MQRLKKTMPGRIIKREDGNPHGESNHRRILDGESNHPSNGRTGANKNTAQDAHSNQRLHLRPLE
eukprot:2492423-Prorocentrum_lima.AAC.1